MQRVSSSNRQCKTPHASGPESSSAEQNRYYLHHHSQHYLQNRPLRTIRSFLSVTHFSTPRSNSITNHGTKTNNNEGPKSSHSQSVGQNLHLRETSRSKRVPSDQHLIKCGHFFIAATCTRLKSDCEVCRHSIHSHKYIYCRNCPVLCHNRSSCFEKLMRQCPAPEYGLEGWGESQQVIQFMGRSTVDVESVYLSAKLGLQANRCAECQCPLESKAGRQISSKSMPDVSTLSVHQSDSPVSSSSNPSENSTCNPSKGSKKAKNRLQSSNGFLHPQNSYKTTSVVEVGATDIRVCHYTGKFYCEKCHFNDKWYIPGSIILLNDTTLQPVCRSVYLKLRILWDSAIIRIPGYWHKEIEEAAKVFQLRKDLHDLQRYALICTVARAIKEVAELSMPTHLLGFPNHLRMCDVLDVLSGRLFLQLKDYFERIQGHVATCNVCSSINERILAHGSFTVGGGENRR